MAKHAANNKGVNATSLDEVHLERQTEYTEQSQQRDIMEFMHKNPSQHENPLQPEIDVAQSLICLANQSLTSNTTQIVVNAISSRPESHVLPTDIHFLLNSNSVNFTVNPWWFPCQ